MATDPDVRRLRWDACFNTRDLGGLPAGERTTRWRAIVRSDNLCRLTWHGRRALRRYGVRTVIDLRWPEELALEHDPLARGDLPGLTYRNVPMVSDEFRWTHRPGARGHDYDLIALATCGKNIASAISEVAAAREGGVVIYCHAGKERTGLIAALLLALAGVAPEVVAAEHAATDRYLAPLYEAWAANQPSPSEREAFVREMLIPADQMVRTLDHVERAFGGVAAYLSTNGLPEEQIDLARRRLIA